MNFCFIPFHPTLPNQKNIKKTTPKTGDLTTLKIAYFHAKNSR